MLKQEKIFISRGWQATNLTRPTGLPDATSVPMILVTCKARWNSMFNCKPVLIAKHGEIPWLIAIHCGIPWLIAKYGDIPWLIANHGRISWLISKHGEIHWLIAKLVKKLY